MGGMGGMGGSGGGFVAGGSGGRYVAGGGAHAGGGGIAVGHGAGGGMVGGQGVIAGGPHGGVVAGHTGMVGGHVGQVSGGVGGGNDCGTACGDACVPLCGDACMQGGACAGGACGVGACGCESYDESSKVSMMSYTGPGRGEYSAVTTYKYVGQGGDFNQVIIPTGRNYCFCLLPLLLLPLLLLLRPQGPQFCGQCLIDNCPYVKMHQCETCLVKQGAFMTQGSPCGSEFCDKATILQNRQNAASGNKLCTTLPDPTQVCVPPAPEPTPVQPTPAPSVVTISGACILFGDPHIMTFD